MNRIKIIVILIAILSCCLVLGSIVFCKKCFSKGNEIKTQKSSRFLGLFSTGRLFE